MPYIDTQARVELGTAFRRPEAVGELNYEITLLVDEWITDQGGLSYTNVNNAVGVLECAKLELYRRLAAPYEDQKIAENGEVYQNLPEIS